LWLNHIFGDDYRASNRTRKEEYGETLSPYDNKMSLLSEAKKLQDDIVKHRRHLHQNPEIGVELPATVAYVKNALEKLGYDPVACGGGIVALAGGEKKGKVFMLRADMDALPMKEETVEPFKSVNGYMHACGHDMHTAMLLGAAKLLKDHEEEIEGTVKLMFQPGEETMEGCLQMINAGVLENPKVDEAMMLHVFTGIPSRPGVVLMPQKGNFSASSDVFKITVHGKGCHGAMPYMGVDSNSIASFIHLALQEIIAREVPSGENLILTIGQKTGGTAPNIISDTAYMRGTIRTFNTKWREYIKERVVDVSKNIALAFRGEATVEYEAGCPCVVHEEESVRNFNQYLTELLPEENYEDMDTFAEGLFKTLSGSEDFGYVTERVPGIFAAMAVSSDDASYQYPQHHPRARFDESSLYIGSAVYAGTAIKWLKDH